MKILIGGVEITAKSCYAFEQQNGRRFLRMTIAQSDIDYTSLKAALAANTGEIVVTKDDGTTETYSGYKVTYEIHDKTDDDGTAVWFVPIVCVAEAERRALEAQAKAVALEATVAAQAETIAALETANAELQTTMEENDTELLYQLSLAQLGVTEDEI